MPRTQVAITTATLDPQVGREMCELAVERAGLPCKHFVSHDKVRQGGVKTANVGLRWALKTGCSYICYMNDDVEIRQKDWLARLVEVLETSSNFGSAGPGGKCATAPQGRKAKPGMPKGFSVVQQLSHFCIVHKREVLEQVGIFDEAFFHYACDNDWNRRARKAGWKLLWVHDVFVIHHGCNPSRRQPKWMKHDQTLYRKCLKEGYYR